MRLQLSSAATWLMLSATLSAAETAQDREPRQQRLVAREVAEWVSTHLYQGRSSGPEQTERFSRKIKIGRDGRVSVQNVAGDITVTGGVGDEVSIEAVKRTRGNRSQLAAVSIEVEERAGRVEVRTLHTGRYDRVSVDYTITLPSSTGVEVRSISGNVKVTNVQGAVRGDTTSGDITMAGTPRLENARSISGTVSLSGVSSDGDLSVGTVSGNLTASGVKVRSLDLGTISGDVTVTDVTCDRLGVKSISGNVDFGGRIMKGGRYELNSHSGDVRLTLANPVGFELNASSFSGSVRSDLPVTINSDSGGRDRGRRGRLDNSMRATYGDGSATLRVRTFSGAIVLTER